MVQESVQGLLAGGDLLHYIGMWVYIVVPAFWHVDVWYVLCQSLTSKTALFWIITNRIISTIKINHKLKSHIDSFH